MAAGGILTLEWRPVPGFPSHEVSEYGDIRRKGAGGSPVAYAGRVLVPNSHGTYLRVALMHHGVRRDLSVHRLVCEAFHGAPPSPEHQAAHRDGKPRNNHYNNLYWATPIENARDKIEHGRQPRGEQIRNHKFCVDEIREIRARYAAGGLSQDKLAAIYDTSQSNIGRIVRRQTWAAVS